MLKSKYQLLCGRRGRRGYKEAGRPAANAYCIGGADLSITTDLTCASLLFMKRGDGKKYICQMYWLPAGRLAERVRQDKIPYDKWFVETVKQYDLFPAWVYYDSYFVEEMQMQGFNMVRCIQGAKTLSLPMQMLGVDLSAEIAH